MSAIDTIKYLLLDTAADTTGSATSTAAVTPDYWTQLFDNPLRIFLVVINAVGALSTIVLNDKNGLDVTSIT
jgi:hypothetical protein